MLADKKYAIKVSQIMNMINDLDHQKLQDEKDRKI